MGKEFAKNNFRKQGSHGGHKAGGGGGGAGAGGGGQNYIRDVNKYKGWKNAQLVRKKLADTDRFHKQKALKKYANLCKKEGIESTRVNMNRVNGVENSKVVEQENNSDNGAESDSEDNNRGGGKNNKNKSKFAKPIKKDPFAAAKVLAVKKEEEKQQKELEEEQKKKEIEKAERKRDHLRKQHMKRTSRGQPLLNDKIMGLLEKIKKSK